jgi:glycosyltransferase involved in cell wall biosynthesis
LVRIYNSILSRYIIDLCIPVYREKGYLESTLKHLTHQTLYKRGMVHIIVGEYKEPIDRTGYYIESVCSQYPNVDYIKIEKKSIGYSRATMIEKLGLSDNIMCMDADSIFNRIDAIERMLNPILGCEAIFTNCSSLRYDFQKNKITHYDLNLYNILHIGDILSDWLLFASGPGLTVRRDAYDSVGGFKKHLMRGEDTDLSYELIKKYGPLAKKFIDNVHIYTSDRRARGFEKIGEKAFDYKENYFR